jgi:hypothetical protein
VVAAAADQDAQLMYQVAFIDGSEESVPEAEIRLWVLLQNGEDNAPEEEEQLWNSIGDAGTDASPRYLRGTIRTKNDYSVMAEPTPQAMMPEAEPQPLLDFLQSSWSTIATSIQPTVQLVATCLLASVLAISGSAVSVWLSARRRAANAWVVSGVVIRTAKWYRLGFVLGVIAYGLLLLHRFFGIWADTGVLLALWVISDPNGLDAGFLLAASCGTSRPRAVSSHMRPANLQGRLPRNRMGGFFSAARKQHLIQLSHKVSSLSCGCFARTLTVFERVVVSILSSIAARLDSCSLRLPQPIPVFYTDSRAPPACAWHTGKSPFWFPTILSSLLRGVRSVIRGAFVLVALLLKLCSVVLVAARNNTGNRTKALLSRIIAFLDIIRAYFVTVGGATPGQASATSATIRPNGIANARAAYYGHLQNAICKLAVGAAAAGIALSCVQVGSSCDFFGSTASTLVQLLGSAKVGAATTSDYAMGLLSDFACTTAGSFTGSQHSGQV